MKQGRLNCTIWNTPSDLSVNHLSAIPLEARLRSRPVTPYRNWASSLLALQHSVTKSDLSVPCGLANP